jgi:hypothetical protein
MMGNDERVSTAENYRRFARYEAAGRSPIYEALCEWIAADAEALERITSLPLPKRQPNLVLASVRACGGDPLDPEGFRRVLLERWDDVAACAVTHRTQTNEVGRCAMLLTALAGIPEPLALVEVGASAGLCLLLDRYAYDYGEGRLGAPDASVLIDCTLRAPGTPVPRALPEVVWRVGLDLAPVDLEDEAARRWLELLVWPEQRQRLERLRAAIEVARAAPPPLVAGDLRADLADLAASAPAEATLVVFHSAVLGYVTPDERVAFAAQVRAAGAVWVANEEAGVLADIERQLRAPEVVEGRGSFVLSRDGAPLAWADPHGAWLAWRS